LKGHWNNHGGSVAQLCSAETVELCNRLNPEKRKEKYNVQYYINLIH
jgi:hypothetical protein